MFEVTDEKYARELELEREMEENGAENARRLMEKAEGSGMETGAVYGSALLKRGVEALAAAVAGFIEENSRKAGRRHTAAKLLEIFPDKKAVAFLALRQVLNGISQRQSLSRTALSVADTLQKEARLIKFKEDEPELYGRITKLVKSRNEHHRFASISVAMGRNEIGFDKWTLNERTQLGVKLIDLIASSTGYIEVTPLINPKSHRNTNYVSAAAKCREWIETCRESALMSPEYMPSIIPPKPWTSPFDGGYYSKIKPLWLMKARFSPRNYLEELNNRVAEMAPVYKAVNAIQSTPYRINSKVYAVMTELWEKGAGKAGLLKREESPLPFCPVCGNAVEGKGRKHACFEGGSNAEAFKSWKREAEKVYGENARLFSKKLQLSKILYLAEKFKNEEAIYFPVQLDFRGRAYPVPSFLQPQGSDWAKGLLEFAEAKPLEDIEAVRWLAVHGANLYGEDKISLEDRFIWVLEHEAEITACALEPVSSEFWQGASKPFQFLAFCFEWAGYADACEKGRVFYSRMPVAMDGTCNGLQIFSLLLRDREGGLATNLLPSGSPKDIYGIVAAKVEEKLRQKAETGVKRFKKGSGGELYDEKELAGLLLNLGVDRKATKRQVMTLPYGATFASCKDYTNEWLLSQQEKAPDNPLFTRYPKTFNTALFLGEQIWEAIHETVTAAKGAMEYLRAIAGAVAKEQLPVIWTTPVGLKIMQAYKETRSRRVKCELGGGLVFVSLNEETPKIDTAEQKNGICPNFIHSLDAAAMMKTVDIAMSKGVTSFSMVHDSYATHASEAVKLAASLREAFVELFKDDLLERFKEEVTKVLKPAAAEKLPAAPEKGTLDISAVMESDYFFA